MPGVVRRYPNLILATVVLLAGFVMPLFFDPLANFVDDAIIALAFVVMALGLNLIVGFAGLLDLGFVAFYAFGAYTIGWFASDFFSPIAPTGVHIGADQLVAQSAGIHVNWLLLVPVAMLICAVAGILIGLPTLRLRGDYIAIVTLAFGEIIFRFAANGDEINPSLGGTPDLKLTNGRQAISPLDDISLPFVGTLDGTFTIRPFYWIALVMVGLALLVSFRLRDSRLGRAWIAIREDEVAAASMGVPLVKTKLLAYATGGALGGAAGAFIGAYENSVNGGKFQFGFSIFFLSMVILGGLGSIWGVVIGAIVMSFINTFFIPDVFNSIPGKLGLDFDLTEINFGIFGFLIVLMMVLRPEGLLPERRRRLELREGAAADENLAEQKT